MFLMYLTGQQEKFLVFAEDCYRGMTQAFVADDIRTRQGRKGSAD